MKSKFRIGDLELGSRLILAPMSGVTNTSFRRLMQSENPACIGLLVTEFISVEGLTRKIPQTLRLLKFYECERPISVQIFGYDIARMRDAAIMVEQAGADVVDINCGCPAPKVVRKGGGCELMRQPKHLQKILREVRAAVRIPLTLKIRSGWDDSSLNALDVATMAEDCGIDMLAIHGRSREQLYRGMANWDIVQEVASKLSIPVVGSGDVVDADGARDALDKGVAAIMIGRAALSNPWVFREIEAGLAGRRIDIPGEQETIRVMKRYMELLGEEMPEKGVIGKMKQFSSQVTRRIRGSSVARRALCLSQNLDEFNEKLDSWADYLIERQNGAGNIRLQDWSPLFEPPVKREYVISK